MEKLCNDGHDVTVLDNLSNGLLSNLEHLKNKITTYLANVEQIQSTNFMKKFDGIFHLATAPRSSSLIDPMRDIESNCKGMIAMLELARAHGAKIVFTSNSGIYGSAPDGTSINENFDNNPTTPYDANKLVSEYYCKIYHRIHKVRSTVVRFATVYGERQQVNERLNWRPLVATFVKNLMNNEEVAINGDGEQTRDLIYVQDAVQGVIRGMESIIENADIFLISTNTETSVNQVLHYVEDITGLKSRVRHTEPLPGDIRRMKYDNSKAKEKLDFRPKYSVEEGIMKIVEHNSRKMKDS